MNVNAYESDINDQPWWVQRWTDLLNTYRFKKRLERGRKYAREGHILSIEFQDAAVRSKVQGTAADPYELTISIDPFTDEDWEFVVRTMAQKAIYSAQLLAGEMPHNIEEVFTSNGLSLFPFTLSDVHSRCSCPDPQNPCKHIAAVYYQLGDLFREDPFVLFQLRGRTKAQVLDALREKRSQGATLPAAKPAEQSIAETAVDRDAELDLRHFWHYDAPLDPSLVVIAPSDSRTLDVLGTIPLAASDAQAAMQVITQIYQTASQQAMLTALRDADQA